MAGMDMMMGSILKSLNIDPDKLKADMETAKTAITNANAHLQAIDTKVSIIDTNVELLRVYLIPAAIELAKQESKINAMFDMLLSIQQTLKDQTSGVIVAGETSLHQDVPADATVVRQLFTTVHSIAEVLDHA